MKNELYDTDILSFYCLSCLLLRFPFLISSKIDFNFHLYVFVFVCVSGCHIAWLPSVARARNPSELEFKAVLSIQCGFGGLNSGSLEEQQMILTAVPSLCPLFYFSLR